MVRTRDTASVKVAGAKASRKVAPVPASPCSSSESKNKYSGGNPYCPRETPAWQKPITNFFTTNGAGASTSSDVESKKESSNEKPEEECSIAEEGSSGEQSTESSPADDAGSSTNGADGSKEESGSS